AWDRGNKYTMAWQSGFTTVAYNSSVIKNPGASVDILFDRKYAGKIGMMSDVYELGSIGLLALGIDPATSTESEWQSPPRSCSSRRATASSAPTTTRATSATSRTATPWSPRPGRATSSRRT